MIVNNEIILPEGYNRVPYLESDGYQWIDTGILPLGKKVEMKFSITDDTDTTGLFGSRQNQTKASASSHNFFVYKKKLRIDYTWNNRFNNFDHILNEDITCVINEDGSVMFNNTLFKQILKRTSCSYPIYLFNFNNVGTPYTKGTPQRLYYCKIADDRYFIPVVNQTGTLGMLDVLTDTFYTNQGIGEFKTADTYKVYRFVDTSARRRMIMASYKSILPAEYQRVEYIEGYGGDSWINTNKCGMLSTELTAKCLYMGEHSNHNYAQLMGVYNGSGNSITFNGKILSNNSASSRFGTKSVSASGSFNLSQTLILDCWINKNSFGWKYENETTREFALNYDTEFSTQNDANKVITIFRANGYGAYGKWRFYDFTHSRSGVMIQHLIPCYRKADKVAGMYDVIEGIFYTNAGTGTFTVGKNIKG